MLSFVIYNAMGQIVDQVLRQYCKEGRNIIQFNVASLANGSYFLKMVDEHGNVSATHPFVKQ